jgi:hypothetical protein
VKFNIKQEPQFSVNPNNLQIPHQNSKIMMNFNQLSQPSFQHIPQNFHDSFYQNQMHPFFSHHFMNYINTSDKHKLDSERILNKPQARKGTGVPVSGAVMLI